VLDIPCGDLTWLLHDPSVLGAAAYTGADVSAVVVERNRVAHEALHPSWRFEVVDAVEGPPLARLLTATPALVLCRHMMYHLPPADNLRALQRLEASGASYLLLTTHLRSNLNLEPFALAAGHPINLFRRPYCLRDPLRLFPDNGRDAFLGLWLLPAAYAPSERHLVPPLMDSANCME